MNDHRLSDKLNIFAYRGFTTVGKLASVEKLGSKKLEQIFRDDTNSIVKNRSNEYQKFDNFEKFVEAVDDTFESTKTDVCVSVVSSVE